MDDIFRNMPKYKKERGIIMKNWQKTDRDAIRTFVTTYKEGTWNKGGFGKALFAVSMIVYFGIFAYGTYALMKKLFNLGEKIGEKLFPVSVDAEPELESADAQ